MNRFGKIAIAVIVLALVVCIYLFWPAITGAINGNKYYTASDVQSAYDKGYDDGVGDKSQYEEVIKAYKEKVQSLNLTIAKNDKTISGLQDSIKTKDAEIDGLEKQIEELSPYKDKADELNALIDKLNKTISEQEKTIEYYEYRISDLEDEDTIFVTFEVDNSVYSVEKIARGAKVTTIVNPTSTEHAKFVGWYLGEELINLDSYTFNTSAKLVAKFERSYTVRFMVDNKCYNEQLVVEGDSAALPTTPTLTDDGAYTFTGWTLNGEVVDVDDIKLTTDAIFTAQFTRNSAILVNTVWCDYFKSLDVNFICKFKTVVFDYYTDNNMYMSNGVDMIENIAPVSIGDDNKIKCYFVETKETVYVLSNYIIQPDVCSCMFMDILTVEKIEFNNFDTSNTTDMSEMFFGGFFIKELDLSGFDTSKVTNMNAMFFYCDDLKTIYVGDKFTTSAVSNLANNIMFSCCESLVGAISYDRNKTDGSVANYINGYFTYKEV